MSLRPPEDRDRDAEIASLRSRLSETEDILEAIRAGEVDALLITGAGPPAVYTLKGADSPYRLLVERMRQGALTLSDDGIILYCNDAFATMVGLPSTSLRGTHFDGFLADAAPGIRALFSPDGTPGKELRLKTPAGDILHAYLSSAPLDGVVPQAQVLTGEVGYQDTVDPLAVCFRRATTILRNCALTPRTGSRSSGKRPFVSRQRATRSRSP